MSQRSTVLFLAVALMVSAAVIFVWPNLGNPIQNVSAVTTGVGIGVYWNARATNSCQSISWGKLSPGSSKTIIIYVKNLDAVSLFYLLQTRTWVPSEASQYLALIWDYSGGKAVPGSIMRVALTLLVSTSTRGIADFSFDITILGNPNLWGDINLDGRVNILDMAILGKAYGSSPGMSTWNPAADINADERVDIKDVTIAAKDFGKVV